MSENAPLLAAAISFPTSGAAVWITWMTLRYRTQQRNAQRNADKAARSAAS